MSSKISEIRSLTPRGTDTRDSDSPTNRSYKFDIESSASARKGTDSAVKNINFSRPTSLTQKDCAVKNINFSRHVSLTQKMVAEAVGTGLLVSSAAVPFA